MYKTIVVDYEPIAKNMADTIEEVCNKQLIEKTGTSHLLNH